MLIDRGVYNHLLFPTSLCSTPTEPTGTGWFVTYDCFLFTTDPHILLPRPITATDGFLIRIHLSHLLQPLYISDSSSFLDSFSQLLHLPLSYFSSYSSTLNFVLSILCHIGVPTSDPQPLARLIFSFANHHHLSATISPVTLFISFTSTIVLHDHTEAADWVHGGTPESRVVKTLRTTFESMRMLKDERLDGSCLMKSCTGEEKEEKSRCMVCLEGFEEEDAAGTKRSLSRLPCCHMFHFTCISQWLSLHHRCPVCCSPMPWVHAFFPDLPSYLDDLDNVDNDGDNLVVDSYYSSGGTTEEASGIITKLGCFVKKFVQIMSTLDLFSEHDLYSSFSL